MNMKDTIRLPEQNDYLWDGTGTPDPEIQRLESLLAEFRHDGRPLVLPETLPKTNVRRAWILPLRWVAAAVVLLTLGTMAHLAYKSSGVSEPQIAWDCSALSGSPQ